LTLLSEHPYCYEELLEEERMLRRYIPFSGPGLLLFTSLTWGFGVLIGTELSRHKSVLWPAMTSVTEGGKLAIYRASGNMFYVNARINGHTVRLMVDTGASYVSISQATADRLGIDYAYKSKVSFITPGGKIEGQVATVNAIELGLVRVEDVPVAVFPELSESLLGMSFLSRLTRYEFRGAQLILEQFD
jgi:aspartyl protease family protein